MIAYPSRRLKAALHAPHDLSNIKVYGLTPDEISRLQTRFESQMCCGFTHEPGACITLPKLRNQLLLWRYLTVALIIATVGGLVWHASLTLWICLMVLLACLGSNVVADRRLRHVLEGEAA